MFSSANFLRFSWTARPESANECGSRLNSFLTGVKKQFPSCILRQQNEEGVTVQIKLSKKHILSMATVGTVIGDASSMPITDVGYTIPIIATIDGVELYFQISCGSASNYVDNVCSCTFSTNTNKQYSYPLPESEFLSLCSLIVHCWAPTSGLYTYHEIDNALQSSPSDPEIGLLTYIAMQADIPSQLPPEFQHMKVNNGCLIWLRETVTRMGRATIVRSLKKLGKTIGPKLPRA